MSQKISVKARHRAEGRWVQWGDVKSGNWARLDHELDPAPAATRGHTFTDCSNLSGVDDP